MTDVGIRYFLEIVNQGSSFTAASRKLHVSQPALTMQMQSLGKELGVKLFDTSIKSAPSLTPAGHLFYELFSKFQKEFLHTKTEAFALANRESGELRIAGFPGWNTAFLYASKENFQKKYPHITISYAPVSFQSLQSGLSNNHFDIIISHTSEYRKNPKISTHDHYRDLGILIFHSRHPLAQQHKTGKLSIKDFKDSIFFILSGSGDFQRKEFENYFEAKGFNPRFQELPDFDSLLLALHDGNGCAIWSKSFLGKDHPTLRYISMPGFYFITGEIWKKDNKNPALQYYLEECVLNQPLQDAE
jgi:DNA-binding transcriptional LysR family regulator